MSLLKIKADNIKRDKWLCILHCNWQHLKLCMYNCWVPVKSVTSHIGDKSIRWQSTRWQVSVSSVTVIIYRQMTFTDPTSPMHTPHKINCRK